MSLPNHNDPLVQMKLAKLAKLEEQAELRRKFPHLYMHKWYKWSWEMFNDWTHKKQVLCAANQLGKAQEYQTLIATPSGFKQLGTLKVGDQVIGDNGLPCEIIDTPWRGVDEYYEIEFDDGTTVRAGQNHLWRCKGYAQRFRKQNKMYGQWTVLSTKQIFEQGKYDSPFQTNGHRFVIPYTEPVEYPAKDLFDPYALGVILGDGSIASDKHMVIVTTPEVSIKDYLEKNFQAKSTWHDGKNCYSVRMPAETCKVYLREMSLIGTYSETKFIPEEYMLSSKEQRLALLQGLMDTDGTVNLKGDAISFGTTSDYMADSLVELVFSLGGTCKRRKRKSFYTHKGLKKRGMDSNNITIKLPPGIAPFKLAKNKIKRWKVLEGHIRYKHERVIYDIRPIGPREGMCISVDSPNECYITGQNYVVTHNSSSVIKKLIDMAISPERWAEAWPELIATGQKPSQWWYLYPTKDVATVEFNEKWKMFLPNVPEDDPKYGWTVKKGSYATVHSIHFNTGVTIYFKAYKQDVQALQTGSAALLVLDEEAGINMLPELQMRVNATNGFMFFVFTATMGQKFWREVVEERTRWPDARIWQVSLYDSMEYTDGSPSMWTADRIEAAKRSCMNENEVQRRIMGKFVLDSGLLFPQFDQDTHVKPYHPIPSSWELYAGIDYGTGGNAHPASIVICGINPERTQVRVIRAWRGDKQNTTAQDIVNEYLEMTKKLKVNVAYYDYGPGGRDIGTIANRLGLPFEPADKGTETGRAIIQSLLKNKALIIYETEDLGLQQVLQTGKLIDEFITGVEKADKRSQRNDDLLDALRYCLSKIGFDWDAMTFGEKKEEASRVIGIDEMRREGYKENEDDMDIEEEFEFWQEQFEM